MKEERFCWFMAESIPASFSPDTIVVYAGEFGGNSDIDDIFYSSGAPLPPPTVNTDFTWNQADSGKWEDGKWTPSGGPPGRIAATQSSCHAANFGDAIGSETRTVFTDDGVTVNAINFSNSMGGSYRLAGSPAYNLIASTGGVLPVVLPSLGVTGGSHAFQAPVSIHANTTADIASGSTLIFNNALNLNGNTLTKSGTGELAIRNDLLTGGGTVSIQQGTVSGNGTVSGDLNNEGGTISPGNSLAEASAVPEPGTVFLIVIGTILFSLWRTRGLKIP